MIWKLIGIIGLIIFFRSLALWIVSDWRETRRNSEINQDVEDYNRLKDRIRQLNETLNEIEKLEELIADIDECDPSKRHSNFSVHWGGRNKYGFMLDGEGITTEDLRTLAIDEHERLCTSLLRQIQELQGK